MTIDHIAHPSFDAAATHRFYSDVLGAHLVSAFSGDNAEWGARYLLAAYRLDGIEIDFFTYAGIARPPADGLPRDIRHVGIAVPTNDDLDGLRARIEAQAVDHWIEQREDGSHLYIQDPNGLILEFSPAAPPFAGRADALSVLQEWIG